MQARLTNFLYEDYAYLIRLSMNKDWFSVNTRKKTPPHRLEHIQLMIWIRLHENDLKFLPSIYVRCLEEIRFVQVDQLFSHAEGDFYIQKRLDLLKIMQIRFMEVNTQKGILFKRK